MSEIERRYYQGEIRLDEADDSGPTISGYAAVFGQESEDLGGFTEVIEPGAFSEAVNDDVRALFNHDSNLILGRNRSGTLALSEDDLGLRYEIEPPSTQYAEDLLVSLRRGDVDQSSFGFLVVDEAWETKDGAPLRRVKKVKLFDVSPVTFPAYPQTSAEARGMAVKISQAGGATDLEQTDQAPAGRLALMRKKLDLLEQE